MGAFIWAGEPISLMLQLIHMTGTYSNAILVAILPHVSDYAKKLDLPLINPVTAGQVAIFNPSPYKDMVGAGLGLTNGYWFTFANGHIDMFRSPDDLFYQQDFGNLQRFVGKENMTTNDAITLAREAFRKLGFDPQKFHLDALPENFTGPRDLQGLGHIPFCQIEWDSPDAKTTAERAASYSVQFDVDLGKKQIIGMALTGTNFWKPDPTLGVTPELQSAYSKRIQGKMFTRTNAPVRFLEPKPIRIETDNHILTNSPALLQPTKPIQTE